MSTILNGEVPKPLTTDAYKIAESPKMVIVPQAQLDELEVARRKLYEMFGEDIDTDTLIKLQEISQPMWRVANTNWEVSK